MKNYYIYPLFFLTSILLTCCTSKEKSVDVLLFNTKNYKSKNKLQKTQCLDSAFIASKKLSNGKNTRDFLFNLSTEYYYLNNTKKSLKVSNSLLDLSIKGNDSLDIAKAYHYIGDCYETEKKDSAYYYYQKAEGIYSNLKNAELEAKMQYNKSYILFLEGSYLECEIMLTKSLSNLKKSKNLQLFSSLTNLMGCNFERLEDYDNAIKYYNLSKDYLEELKKTDKDYDKINNYTVATTVNIANIYEKQQKYTKAIVELESILKKDLKTKWPENYATVIGNLGYCKMKLGEFNEAEKLLFESLNISLKNKKNEDVAYKLKNLGEFYLLRKDTAKAVENLKKSLALAEKLKSGDQIRAILKLIAKADIKNDSEYNQKYIKISDSIYKLQKKTRDKYARIAYETSKIEDENKFLIQKNVVVLSVAFVIIVLLSLLLMLRYLKGKKDQIAFLLSKHEANNELFELMKDYEKQIIETKNNEQNRISRELHDNVMNKLYGVRLHLGILNDFDDLAKKEKRLYYIALLQEIEIDIRTLSHDLNEGEVYKNFDFYDVLIKMIEQQNEAMQTQFVVSIDKDIEWNEVSGIKKINLYRILQELILNVNKHAKATKCTIDINLNFKNEIILKVKDNGIGFKQQKRKNSIGHKNIEKRVSTIKGNLKINSEIGIGTNIEILIAVAD